MKPVIRWTIGNGRKKSADCLRLSVKKIKHLYGSIFDLIVCNNGPDLEVDGVQTIRQSESELLGKLPPGPHWKICPPRLRRSAHEIFMDNDLVVYKRLPAIEEFLDKEDLFFATEGLRRRFGSYDPQVPDGMKINSGLFGLPPNYDFEQDIKNSFSGTWHGWFEEQGLVASILSKKKLKIVSLEEISVCVVGDDEFGNPINNLKFGRCGAHFVGLNQGNEFCFDEFQKNQGVKLI